MPRRGSLKVIERRIRELEAKAEKIKRLESNPAIPKIVRLMRKNRISIGELRSAIGGRASKANGRRGRPSAIRGRKDKPHYPNSKTGETWRGRDRPPHGIAPGGKAGCVLSDFLIQNT